MDTLVVGEALVDVVRRGAEVVEYPGGSAANAAVALARLGRPVRLWTAYAGDAGGAVLDHHLTEAGIRLATDPHVLDRTPSATATIGATGAASYVFDVDWRLADAPATDTARFVHVCSWGPVLEPGAGRVRDLLSTTAATVTYDVNVRPAVTGVGPGLAEAVERTAALAQLVKASDEDLEVLYPGYGLEEAAARLRALGPRAVVVTRGAEGATWFGAQVVSVGAMPVLVADTIGAGDTFGAALLDALWDDDLATISQERIAAVLRHAVRAAAVTVSRPGADPPYASELLG
ncbi:PfkB family carbohydrate kinase [Nocardioides sp. DS6]|uniref:PfkB family carbohydrate kinase n=1 Tax=Nocardioides eburneus TaxID=3231482 RepID=A0ABV3SUS2_9ACTN